MSTTTDTSSNSGAPIPSLQLESCVQPPDSEMSTHHSLLGPPHRLPEAVPMDFSVSTPASEPRIPQVLSDISYPSWNDIVEREARESPSRSTRILFPAPPLANLSSDFPSLPNVPKAPTSYASAVSSPAVSAIRQTPNIADSYRQVSSPPGYVKPLITKVEPRDMTSFMQQQAKGVVFSADTSISLDTYLSAIVDSDLHILPLNITHAARAEGTVKLYLSEVHQANILVQNGFDLGNKHIHVEHLHAAPVRILINNIPMMIPNSVIRQHLLPYGQVLGDLRPIRSNTKNNDFQHVKSLTREARMVFSTADGLDRIPHMFRGIHGNLAYNVYISKEKKCTACSRTGHTRSSCMAFPSESSPATTAMPANPSSTISAPVHAPPPTDSTPLPPDRELHSATDIPAVISATATPSLTLNSEVSVLSADSPKHLAVSVPDSVAPPPIPNISGDMPSCPSLPNCPTPVALLPKIPSESQLLQNARTGAALSSPPVTYKSSPKKKSKSQKSTSSAFSDQQCASVKKLKTNDSSSQPAATHKWSKPTEFQFLNTAYDPSVLCTITGKKLCTLLKSVTDLPTMCEKERILPCQLRVFLEHVKAWTADQKDLSQRTGLTSRRLTSLLTLSYSQFPEA